MTGPLLLALALQGPVIPDVIVTVETPETLPLVAGKETRARVVATVAEGFKIQANPAADRFLIPATLTIEPDDRVLVGEPEYPPGTPHRLRGATSDLSIYEETVELFVPLTAIPGSDSTELVLEGELRFQACNDVVCLKPTSVPVRLPVSVSPGEGAPQE